MKEEIFLLEECPNCMNSQEWSYYEQKCYCCGYKFYDDHELEEILRAMNDKEERREN